MVTVRDLADTPRDGKAGNTRAEAATAALETLSVLAAVTTAHA